MIAPLAIKYSPDVDVLYVSYADGTFSHTEAVDAAGEILADIASDGRVLGLECLSVEPQQRPALEAFAARHDLKLPPEIDSFQQRHTA